MDALIRQTQPCPSCCWRAVECHVTRWADCEDAPGANEFGPKPLTWSSARSITALKWETRLPRTQNSLSFIINPNNIFTESNLDNSWSLTFVQKLNGIGFPKRVPLDPLLVFLTLYVTRISSFSTLVFRFFTDSSMWNRRLVDGAPSQAVQFFSWNFLREQAYYNHNEPADPKYDHCWKTNKIKTHLKILSMLCHTA